VKIELCGATREEPFPFDPYSKARGVKRPVCNRTKGHEALGETPHRQYQIKDYFVLARVGRVSLSPPADQWRAPPPERRVLMEHHCEECGKTVELGQILTDYRGWRRFFCGFLCLSLWSKSRA
jgi:hypothetical protein